MARRDTQVIIMKLKSPVHVLEDNCVLWDTINSLLPLKFEREYIIQQR
jgi:hypothetical protein